MKKGFTLIELFVMIAIIGILLSVVYMIASTTTKEEELEKGIITEKQYCRDQYGDRTVDSIPAECLTYFDIKSIQTTKTTSDETPVPEEAYQSAPSCPCANDN